MNLAENLFHSAENYPDRTLVRFYDRSFAYAEMREKVARLASALTAEGIGAGARVGLALPNTPEFLICYYAVIAAGAEVVSINPLYTEYEIGKFIADAGPKLIITHPVVMEASAKAAEKTGVRLLFSDPMGDPAKPGIDRLIEKGDPGFQPVNMKSDDTACIVYTSAMDGVAKGAMLTHGNLMANTVSCQKASSTTAEDRFLAIIPLYHAFAATTCVHLPIYAGGSVEMQELFVEQRALESLENGGITIFTAVPAIPIRLFQVYGEEDHDFPSVRSIVPGGAKMPEEMQKKLEVFFKMPICEGYGITEAGPVSTVNPLDDVSKRKIGSIGPPIPDVTIEIMDDAGRVLPAGETGELCIRGGNVMKGYLNKPEATAAAFRDGSLLTGDLGYKDEDGYIFLTGLKKRMLNVGGLNVYPKEVEDALLRHPDVEACRVDAEPDPVMGDRVRAAVVWKGAEEPNKRSLQKHCRQYLAPYKIPRTVEFQKEL